MNQPLPQPDDEERVSMNAFIPASMVQTLRDRSARSNVSMRRLLSDLVEVGLAARGQGPEQPQAVSSPEDHVKDVVLAYLVMARGNAQRITARSVANFPSSCLPRVFTRPGANEWEVVVDPIPAGVLDSATVAAISLPPNRPEPQHRGPCAHCSSTSRQTAPVVVGGNWYLYCLPCRKATGIKADMPDGDPEVRPGTRIYTAARRAQ